MNKPILKLRSIDPWRIGENESWFSDMAASGLHLNSVGKCFARFVKGPCERVRYRLELSDAPGDLPSDQKKLYAENGWEYVTSFGKFHVFRSPESLGAPDLHTDPAEQSYTLQSLSKQVTCAAWITSIAIFLIFVLIIGMWAFNRTPILALADGSILMQGIVLIVELYVLYVTVQSAASIRTLKKSLAEGKPINHSAPWQKHRRLNFLISLLFCGIACLSIVLPVLQMTMRKTVPMPSDSYALPFIRLGEVENDPALERYVFAQKGIDRGNCYDSDWSPLVPVQYETEEHGLVQGKRWADGSGTYSPSLSTKVYKVLFAPMAKRLVYELMDRYGRIEWNSAFIEKKHPDFDLLLVHETDDYRELCACKGNRVLYVRYFGTADLNRIIELAAKNMDLL